MGNRSIRVTIAALILMAAVGMLIAILLANENDEDINELLSGGCNYYVPTIDVQDVTADDGLLPGVVDYSTVQSVQTTADTTRPSQTSPSDTMPIDNVQTEIPPTETTAEPTETTAPTTVSTTAPQQEEAKKTVSVKITGDWCNIREGAGLKFKEIGKATHGEVYEYVDEEYFEDTDSRWYRIKLNDGQMGYVSGGYSTKIVKLVGAKAYLTFDDGPTENTTKILNILDQYSVKATFFVIYHSGQEKNYKEIVNRGHTLALHSYSHDYEKIYSSQEAYFKDLNKLSDYLEKTTGQAPKLMRFPGGSSNTISRKYCKGIMTDLTAEVQNRGYKYFDWNLDSGDASAYRVKKSKLVNNVRSQLEKGGTQVILMHDAEPKTTTVEALPEIIEALQDFGYEILPLDENSPETHQKVAN